MMAQMILPGNDIVIRIMRPEAWVVFNLVFAGCGWRPPLRETERGVALEESRA